MDVENRVRIAAALSRILDGKNPYYKDRLADPDFVAGVRLALESELEGLMLDAVG